MEHGRDPADGHPGGYWGFIGTPEDQLGSPRPVSSSENPVVVVGVAACNTNLTPLVSGPVIELSKRHAKIRSSR
jgi:hypothetical protein